MEWSFQLLRDFHTNSILSTHGVNVQCKKLPTTANSEIIGENVGDLILSLWSKFANCQSLPHQILSTISSWSLIVFLKIFKIWEGNIPVEILSAASCHIVKLWNLRSVTIFISRRIPFSMWCATCPCGVKLPIGDSRYRADKDWYKGQIRFVSCLGHPYPTYSRHCATFISEGFFSPWFWTVKLALQSLQKTCK